MAQHDYDIANGSGATVRGDINDVLDAVATLNSGASAPSTTFAYMWWIDTTNGQLKQRNSANTAWIVRGTSGIAGVLAKSSGYTVALADFGKLVVCTGTFTIDLPAAATAGDGFTVGVKNVSTGVITIDGNGSETIDGDTTKTLVKADRAMVLRSDGTNWRVVSEAGVITYGTHSIWIPAGAWRPAATSGAAVIASRETTAGRPDIRHLAYDATADEHAQANVAFPKSWDLSTLSYRVFWSSTAADTDGVAWALQGVAVADGDTLDVAYGTAVVVTDDAQGTAEDLYVTAWSGAVTIAGSPGENELVELQLFRDVSDANDDMAEDALMIGVMVRYGVDEGSDD